jgi:hypothetical protein
MCNIAKEKYEEAKRIVSEYENILELCGDAYILSGGSSMDIIVILDNETKADNFMKKNNYLLKHIVKYYR